MTNKTPMHESHRVVYFIFNRVGAEWSGSQYIPALCVAQPDVLTEASPLAWLFESRSARFRIKSKLSCACFFSALSRMLLRYIDEIDLIF